MTRKTLMNIFLERGYTIIMRNMTVERRVL